MRGSCYLPGQQVTSLARPGTDSTVLRQTIAGSPTSVGKRDPPNITGRGKWSGKTWKPAPGTQHCRSCCSGCSCCEPRTAAFESAPTARLVTRNRQKSPGLDIQATPDDCASLRLFSLFASRPASGQFRSSFRPRADIDRHRASPTEPPGAGRGAV